MSPTPTGAGNCTPDGSCPKPITTVVPERHEDDGLMCRTEAASAVVMAALNELTAKHPSDWTDEHNACALVCQNIMYRIKDALAVINDKREQDQAAQACNPTARGSQDISHDDHRSPAPADDNHEEPLEDLDERGVVAQTEVTLEALSAPLKTTRLPASRRPIASTQAAAPASVCNTQRRTTSTTDASCSPNADPKDDEAQEPNRVAPLVPAVVDRGHEPASHSRTALPTAPGQRSIPQIKSGQQKRSHQVDIPGTHLSEDHAVSSTDNSDGTDDSEHADQISTPPTSPGESAVGRRENGQDGDTTGFEAGNDDCNPRKEGDANEPGSASEQSVDATNLANKAANPSTGAAIHGIGDHGTAVNDNTPSATIVQINGTEDSAEIIDSMQTRGSSGAEGAMEVCATNGSTENTTGDILFDTQETSRTSPTAAETQDEHANGPTVQSTAMELQAGTSTPCDSEDAAGGPRSRPKRKRAGTQSGSCGPEAASPSRAQHNLQKEAKKPKSSHNTQQESAQSAHRRGARSSTSNVRAHTAQSMAEQLSKHGLPKPKPKKAGPSKYLPREEIAKLCEKWEIQLFHGIKRAWSSSDRFPQWRDHSLELFRSATWGLEKTKATSAQCSATLSYITFFLIVLCGVIPTQGSNSAEALRDHHSESNDSTARGDHELSASGMHSLRSRACLDAITRMEVGPSADVAARDLRCTFTAIGGARNEVRSMNIVVDMLCAKLVAELHDIEEQLNCIPAFKRQALQRVGRNSHDRTKNNALAQELLGMDNAVLAMLKDSKPGQNTRTDISLAWAKDFSDILKRGAMFTRLTTGIGKWAAIYLAAELPTAM